MMPTNNVLDRKQCSMSITNDNDLQWLIMPMNNDDVWGQWLNISNY